MALGEMDCGLMDGRSAAINGKIYGKGMMNEVRQISRRFDRTAGARTRSVSLDCIGRPVSLGAVPLKTGPVFVLKTEERKGAR